MHNSLNILETIITEVFFSFWVYFYKHLRFTGQPAKGEALSLSRHGGKTFLDKEFMGSLF